MSQARVRVLFTENIAVEAAHRHVYRELAGLPEFDVHLLVPHAWMGAHAVVRCEPEQDSSVRLHQSGILFGYRQHRVLYRDLANVMRQVRPHFVMLDQEPENYAAVQGIVTRNSVSPGTRLALVSSRNIDHTEIGFPYKCAATHTWCDRYVRRHPVDVCVVRTTEAMQYMRDYAGEVVHVPFAVEVERWWNASMQARGAGDRDIVTVGYIGRLIEPKGVKLLVRSLPQLPPYARMMFIGRGGSENELRLLARELGVEARMAILHAVPHDQIPEALARMDIIVVPSMDTKYWKEQCPRVPIEAMSCGVPVVGSTSSGIQEVLGDAGLYFKTGDLDDLVATLRLLITHPPLRQQMMTRGHARAVLLYDVPVIARALAEVIHRTVHHPQAHQ